MKKLILLLAFAAIVLSLSSPAHAAFECVDKYDTCMNRCIPGPGYDGCAQSCEDQFCYEDFSFCSWWVGWPCI